VSSTMTPSARLRLNPVQLHHSRAFSDAETSRDNTEEKDREEVTTGDLEGLAAELLTFSVNLSRVQRWANEGMPVRKEGRFVSTSPDELNAWLGKESGKPVHAVTETTDLTAEPKRGLSYVRHEKDKPPSRNKKR
jgi:hypothetical protein